MTIDRPAHDDAHVRRSLRSAVGGWPVWKLPGGLLGAILTVEATAVALVVLGMIGWPLPSDRQLVLMAGVAGLGLVVTEMSVGFEWFRRRTTGELHVNLGSVWFFAAVLLVPPAWAAATAVVVHGYIRLRTERVRSPIYRYLFSSATTALACVAAGAVLLAWPGSTGDDATRLSLPAVVLAMLVYLTVNTALVGGAIAVNSPGSSAAQVVGDLQENLLEVATLCLGALVAFVVLTNPLLVVFIVPPLLVLHRAVLVGQLETAVDTDGKTGLLTAAAWHRRAELELGRAGRRSRPVAVLVLDLDHFKDVNDTHGHLAGDRVLSAVSDALRAELRDRDLVGRFGGEEFVVMLDGAEDRDVRPTAVAERIRRRIEELRVEMPTPDGPLTIVGLSISVGVAMHPVDGDDLRGLLHVADTALYAAKRAGRNRVRTGAQLPVPLPPLIAVPAAAEPPPTTA